MVVFHICFEWVLNPKPLGIGMMLQPTELYWSGIYFISCLDQCCNVLTGHFVSSKACLSSDGAVLAHTRHWLPLLRVPSPTPGLSASFTTCFQPVLSASCPVKVPSFSVGFSHKKQKLVLVHASILCGFMSAFVVLSPWHPLTSFFHLAHSS